MIYAPRAEAFGVFLLFAAENSCIFLDLWYNKQKYVMLAGVTQIQGGIPMAENKTYITQTQENGSVMISEDVIATIVAQAVSDVEGVVSLSSKPGADIAEMIGKKNWGKGMKITIGAEDELYIDSNVIVAYGQSVVSVAKAVQEAVTGALESMTGVTVASVNVNVCGIARQ